MKETPVKTLMQEPTLYIISLYYYVMRVSSDMVGGNFRPATDWVYITEMVGTRVPVSHLDADPVLMGETP